RFPGRGFTEIRITSVGGRVSTPGLASGAGHGPAGRGTTFTDLAVLILDAGPDPAAYGRDRYPSGRVPAP
ncbi:hypothetical protein, partial [Streptomyces lunaelactis]|uniref:hypothetical protein n=1 Tax=Streptomyces lunaelactis TaxID=1535768 RepID=UPI001584B00E